jgi:catechol 2,3-dioxygenase-like lactoylglutathione lyase family enzyme
MPRGIDHIVHAVRDLDATAALYTSLGFTVGARNLHPPAWGTQNRVVQTPGTYIELLALADTSGVVPHGPRHFSFGAFNRDFLTRGEGPSMLVLRGEGAADADEFRAKGISDFDLFEFEREARKPDGSHVTLSFALAFARDPDAADLGFFTSKHGRPELFWNPAFQKHANGVTEVAGVVMVAADPERHRRFMESFVGGAADQASDGFVFNTPRGVVEMTTPDAFLRHFGVPAPDVSRGARLAAIRFAVADASLMQNAPELAGIAGIYAGNKAIIGANDAMGAVIIFEPAR